MQFEYKGCTYNNHCNFCKFLYNNEDIVYCIHTNDTIKDECTLYKYHIDKLDNELIEISSSVKLPTSIELFKSKYTDFIKPYEYAVMNNFITDILGMGIDSNIILF